MPSNPHSAPSASFEHQKQILYRDARISGKYDGIWQNTGKCVFCDLRDKYILYEANGMVLTISLFAYIDGHCMIVPRRHVTSVKELSPVEWAAVRKLLYIAKRLVKDTHGIKGMQLVQKDGQEAQSTVGHIHFHCIPFDAPDLSVWNVRPLANTPLQNAALYRRSAKKITELAAKFDRKYGAGAGGPAASPTPASPQPPDPYAFDWGDLAFGSKKSINTLGATFIAAPRELSVRRFAQLLKEYLPAGPVVLGISKELYVVGLEGQPQFAMLQAQAVQNIIDTVNRRSRHKIYTLVYSQHETVYLFEKLDFRRVVLVNGSWYHSFHTLPAYYALAKRQMEYSMVSPFADEAEAKQYATAIVPQLEKAYPLPASKVFSPSEMMAHAADAAKFSFDYSYQTGVALGKKTRGGYRFLNRSFNKVVPFQTYAMHYGAAREKHFSPPGDLNHYDATHAEVELIIHAQKHGVDLRGTTMFITLLPCPTCCRMLCETDIAEIVYGLDHSDGYAVEMFARAGKTVRRLL